MTKEIKEINSGDGSYNFQGKDVTVHIHNEFDEKKAKEISEYSARKIMVEYFNNADELAQERMAAFEDEFIPRLASIENALEIFKDPAFKLVYRRAQLQAAVAEKESDYSILTELLVHRFKKKDNKNSCVGINGAIEIVEQISDDALLALTIATSIDLGISPTSGNISQGLAILNDLYDCLLKQTSLPNNSDWLDQLDILRAIRLSSFLELKKLEEFYFEPMEGYFLPGIAKESPKFNEALSLLSSIKLQNLLVEHELMENRVRLPLLSRKSIEDAHRATSMGSFPLSKEEKDILYQVYDLYDTDVELKNETRKKFEEKFNSYPALKQIRAWWNSLSSAFSITKIGKVLGHANAQRCYKKFPALD